MITEVDTAGYDALDKKGPMLVEFYSKTCGPCKMLAFVLKDIEKSMPDLRIYQIEFNENKELKDRCGVKGFPTLLFMVDGKEVSRLEGLKQKPVIVKEIEKIVADFGGMCLTAKRPIGNSTAVVALIRPVGAATPEIICNTIAPSFAADRPIALGPQRTGADGAMRSIQATLYCLQAAPALAATVQPLPRPLRTDDALPERALIGDADARDELVRVVYGSLTAAGPDDPTLLTVSTFLKFGGSLETTAKELNVHPNTIRYRLKRAAESTGWDATDPREAYVLITAIALGRVAEA